MLEMIRYEWKKIMSNSLTRVTLVVAALFFLLSVVSAVMQTWAVDYQGNSYSGIPAIRVLKETQRRTELNQEQVDALVAQYLDFQNNPETKSAEKQTANLSEEAYRSFYLPRLNIFHMIESVYGTVGRNDSTLDVLSKNYRRNFNQARVERDRDYIEWEAKSGRITERQAAYWKKKAEEIGDYAFGYCEAWRQIMVAPDWIMFLMVFVCIGVAPVFAGEYQSKCDSLFLCMKYGKSRLVSAKAITAVLFATVVYWSCILACLLAFFLAYGTEGADLPVQALNTGSVIGYHLTVGQAAAGVLVTGYILTLAMVGFTLLFSALLKNPFYVIIVAFLLILTPVMLQPVQMGYTFRHILYLIPSVFTAFSYESYYAYSLGNRVFSWQAALIIVNAVGALALPLLAQHIFRRHEVNR